MDLYDFFYSIHIICIVSHILSSNGGFLSHGSTPWHHPVVMNEPANWFPRQAQLAQEIMAGRPSGAPDPGHGIQFWKLRPVAFAGNLENHSATMFFNNSSQARNNETTKT